MKILSGLVLLRIARTLMQGQDYINAGKIFVNNIPATLETILQDGDEVELRTQKNPAKETFRQLPIDYEACGYCGYDHDYEYESAKEWHEKNDPEGNLYK